MNGFYQFLSSTSSLSLFLSREASKECQELLVGTKFVIFFIIKYQHLSTLELLICYNHFILKYKVLYFFFMNKSTGNYCRKVRKPEHRTKTAINILECTLKTGISQYCQHPDILGWVIRCWARVCTVGCVFSSMPGPDHHFQQQLPIYIHTLLYIYIYILLFWDNKKPLQTSPDIS